MRKVIFLTIGTALLLCSLAGAQQMVDVTFRANTATVPDTLGPNSVVQIRGTTITPAGHSADDASPDTLSPGVILQWNGASTLFLHNIGGDYWEGTFSMPAGTKLAYKFYTNAHDTVYKGAEWEHKGWEANIAEPPGIYDWNRGLDLTGFTGADTTLPLQFVNGIKSDIEQYFKPYVETDSIDVWVRVNMEAYEGFDPSVDTVGIRGGLYPTDEEVGDLSWSKTFFLTKEKPHANPGSRQYLAGNFYSGRIRIPTSAIGDTIIYKFVIGSEPKAWETPRSGLPNPFGGYNRFFVANKDTTLHWVWWSDIPPGAIVHTDVVTITFQADMSLAIENNGYIPGDTLVARFGYGNSATKLGEVRLIRQGFTNIYAGTDTCVSTIGRELMYQYYLIKRGQEIRESYYDFYYTGEDVTLAERRKVLLTSHNVTVLDTARSKLAPNRMPFFRNLSIIRQPVLVTFTCDLRPAYYQILAGDTLPDIQGNFHVTHPDSVFAWGVWINGPATGGWQTWGATLRADTTRKMYDDGTHGDTVAGDSIYTIQIQFHPDSMDVVGQEFKFGIKGGDNEGGYGNNHIENIDDSQPTCTIACQFGSIDPLFYWAWDYDNQRPRAVEEKPTFSPPQFTLEQNYPNPFNPGTFIQYKLPRDEKVVLKIYNLLGQKIRTLVDREQKAGVHKIRWDGKDDLGREVASGIYFYKIKAGSFTKTRKMLLLK